MNYAVSKIFLIFLFLALPLASVFGESNQIAKDTSLENSSLFFANNADLQEYLETNFTLQSQKENFYFKPMDFSLWEVQFTLEEGYSSEIEDPTLCQKDTSLAFYKEDSPIDKYLSICSLTSTMRSVGHFKKGAVLKVDRDKIEEFVSNLSEKVISAPKNAKIKMEFEKNIGTVKNDSSEMLAETDPLNKPSGKLTIVSPAESGFSLNEEETTELISKALQNPKEKNVIQLPVKEEKPKISSDTLDKLKISEQIGHGESNFAGSPKNRIFNINLATDKFNGILLGPGEEFSFVTILGPVEKETGYKEELVIKENKTIPEYGGGVCQVSTTVFRAALNTGLKITERQNHSYPVQYYSPQGTDATIYLPKPDLKFVNNTPNYILFQSSIEGNKLIFDFFGEPDGRKVEMDGPTVTERTSEGVLKVKLKQIVTDAGGNLLFEDTFNSVYDNPAKYHETELLKVKPDNWSNRQWTEYKKSHNM